MNLKKSQAVNILFCFKQYFIVAKRDFIHKTDNSETVVLGRATMNKREMEMQRVLRVDESQIKVLC